MSTVTSPSPVKPAAPVEPALDAAAISPAPPEEYGLFRDWLTLLVWLGAAAILVLMHLLDFVQCLFRP